MSVVNKLNEAKVNLMAKMAVSSLKSKGSIKGLSFKENGGSLSIGEIAISGDRANSVLDFAASMVGSFKHLDQIQMDPIKCSGDGEFSLIVRNLDISFNGLCFQLEEMEISSIVEGLEFIAALSGDGFADLLMDQERQNEERQREIEERREQRERDHDLRMEELRLKYGQV